NILAECIHRPLAERPRPSFRVSRRSRCYTHPLVGLRIIAPARREPGDRLPLSLWTPECMLMFKVAVVQQPPVVLDRAQTVSSAVLHIAESAAKGATLVVFPETFIPCYPAWIWRLRP